MGSPCIVSAKWQIRVRGQVQGVGFRPFVWRVAKAAGICGEVLNDSEGVIVRLACTLEQLNTFQDTLKADMPRLASIDTIEISSIGGMTEWSGFSIVASEGGNIRTGILPDAATCPECLTDIFDPNNRRFGYAFTNCTNCGPRLSITRQIPYDRANTSMASFEMCLPCQGEYEDPRDRRFHAQPNACPDCGPRLKFVNKNGEVLSGDPIAAAAQALREGKIVAIKGLGGFQLGVDARNFQAVDALRVRKRRPAKPFALLAKNTTEIEEYAVVDQTAKEVLNSAQAPIVLMNMSGKPLASNIAPSLNRLGFMLPSTPLHHLLTQQLEFPIVLTSGNLASDPQVTDNCKALKSLANIADFWLMHDRDIVNRLDDSVVQCVGNDPQIIRRARGYAPAPFRLHKDFCQDVSVLALGADLKNAFCLLKDGQAIVSQHMGDMDNPDTQRDFHANLDLNRRVYNFTPAIIAADLHPEYFSTRLGQKLVVRQRTEIVSVQHHHAHIGAVLAEHGKRPKAKPVLGIALDGLGYGDDGTIWGGEFLLADFLGYKRLAHFNQVPLLGGDKANQQPWRNALAHLLVAFGPDAVEKLSRQYGGLSLFSALTSKPTAMLTQLFTQQLNAPLSSSAGRVFDAAAAMLGLHFDRVQYEGQAAIALQTIAENCPDDSECYPVLPAQSIEWRPLWEGMLQDLKTGVENANIAKRFHNTMINVTCGLATELAEKNHIDEVVLTGGVFQNSLLFEGLRDRLLANNLTVLAPLAFPINDGGLALGQSAIAAARYIQDDKSLPN